MWFLEKNRNERDEIPQRIRESRGNVGKTGIEFLRMSKSCGIQLGKLGMQLPLLLAPIPNIPTWNSHSLGMGKKAPLEPQIPRGAGEFPGFSLWMHLDMPQRAGKAAGKGGKGSIPGKTFGIPEILG